jgi:hypothetical protein
VGHFKSVPTVGHFLFFIVFDLYAHIMIIY